MEPRNLDPGHVPEIQIGGAVEFPAQLPAVDEFNLNIPDVVSGVDVLEGIQDELFFQVAELVRYRDRVVRVFKGRHQR